MTGQEVAKTDKLPVGLQAGLAVFLWLASVVLGGLAIYYLREIALVLFTTFIIRDRNPASFYSEAVTLITWLTFVVALVLVIYIVGSGEYHLKHFRERSSWLLFAWGLGVELVIIAIALFTT
jgi:hypothetical protein